MKIQAGDYEPVFLFNYFEYSLIPISYTIVLQTRVTNCRLIFAG